MGEIVREVESVGPCAALVVLSLADRLPEIRFGPLQKAAVRTGKGALVVVPPPMPKRSFGHTIRLALLSDRLQFRRGFATGQARQQEREQDEGRGICFVRHL